MHLSRHLTKISNKVTISNCYDIEALLKQVLKSKSENTHRDEKRFFFRIAKEINDYVPLYNAYYATCLDRKKSININNLDLEF